MFIKADACFILKGRSGSVSARSQSACLRGRACHLKVSSDQDARAPAAPAASARGSPGHGLRHVPGPVPGGLGPVRLHELPRTAQTSDRGPGGEPASERADPGHSQAAGRAAQGGSEPGLTELCLLHREAPRILCSELPLVLLELQNQFCSLNRTSSYGKVLLGTDLPCSKVQNSELHLQVLLDLLI